MPLAPGLDIPPQTCQPVVAMTSPPAPSLRDLLALSEFARAFPRRAAELLDRCADTLPEERSERRKELNSE